MSNSDTIRIDQVKDADVSWHWTDYISHYRFWAVVIGLFLMTITTRLFNESLYSLLWSAGTFQEGLLQFLFPIKLSATILSASFILYGLRKRFKTALISFALATIVFMAAFFFSLDLPAPIIVAIMWLVEFCSTGFWLTAALVILQGKSDIKSLTIVGLNIYIFSFLFPLIYVITLRYQRVLEVFSEPWHYCLFTIPACISLILIAFANKAFFTNSPRKTIPEVPHPHGRGPVAVALLSAFVPFYYYYFMATRPRELKAIAPSVKTPTGGGMIAMIMFFGLATPIWFAETRKALKAENPENATLQQRSHKFIGFISILFPVFGAAMIQSDMNALEPIASGRGD